MKINHFINSLCIILLVGSICGCTQYPEYEITKPPFVNKTSLEMYKGDKTQVTASPANADFKWTSKNEAIVKVSQTGLVEAVGEGLTTIIVESDDDQITIDVRVRIFVPTVDITLSKQSVQMTPGNKLQVFAYLTPNNASESVVWTSANTNIATISKSGIITAVAKGATTVTATSDGITKNIDISVQ